ncbi:hypothetical protein [Naumannella cuiyingiana]|uniref:Uncharacterized protein n=1 Tax=Naumannella cuiyingiana TaxID=1347891 RepID=A0A7Z0DA05_9ACTN|nr:hypothetical protein [Naumannella cuiyingiana]NYI71687.1 hypothetical protein [Naumannella cuiyingiana]
MPDELLARVGYARWAAALRAAVDELALDPSPTRRPGVLGPDERRLLADRPPHW